MEKTMRKVKGEVARHTNGPKRTSIGNSKRSRYKGKNKKSKYRGQGKRRR